MFDDLASPVGDADDDLVRANDRAECLGTIEHEMGIGAEQCGILMRRGLAFHGVHHDGLERLRCSLSRRALRAVGNRSRHVP